MLEGVNIYARQALNFVCVACVEAGTTVGQAAHMPQVDAARGFGWRIHCGVEVTRELPRISAIVQPTTLL
jgi:hypothetical protein